jgi:hypothetical protein
MSTADELGWGTFIVALIGLPAVYWNVPEFHDWVKRLIKTEPPPAVSVQMVKTFQKNEQWTMPRRHRGDGDEVVVNFEAPGRITHISCSVMPSHDSAWTHQELCANEGNNARWEGWSNSGGPATIQMTIDYLRQEK